jgi:hypothetical protein
MGFWFASHVWVLPHRLMFCPSRPAAITANQHFDFLTFETTKYRELRFDVSKLSIVNHPEKTRPVTDCGREVISIKGLLEWAFATECATLDYDEIGVALGIGLPSVGMEYRIGEGLALGKEPGLCVRPDTSFGRSYPHDDAEIVATILRNAVSFNMAVRVAELARACRVPGWDLGQPVLQPREWGKRNHLGRYGKAEVYREVSTIVRGRKRVRKEYWTPCVWVPSAPQIAAARRGYLDWWGALLSVMGDLRHVDLSRFVLSDVMPPMEPWKQRG